MSIYKNSPDTWLGKRDFYEQVEYHILEPMIRWLRADQHSDVLDAGCGRGIATFIFADQACTVVGVDRDTIALQHANTLLRETSFSDMVMFQQADLYQLPFENDTFDVVWTSYVIHHIADKLHVVDELKRVLKPGGTLAIREGGLPLQMLPHDIGLGEPGLQDRLRVAQNTWFTDMTRDTLSDEKPYPYGWSQLLLDADFTDIQARTFTTDFLPSFNKSQQEFVLYYLQRTLERDTGKYGPLLNDSDRQVIEQLIDENSVSYVLNRSDLHVRYGLSVYVGMKK